MVDGIKIQVAIYVAKYWRKNPRLKFRLCTEVEIYKYEGRFYIAQYKGLKFFIYVHKGTNKVLRCEVRGSLHRFFNNGKHNANDFTVSNLKDVINELETNFNIDRNTATIHNLEIGVNIHTPISADDVLKNLVAYKNYEFVPIRIKRKTVGKIIEQQRHDLKIYDKGKQFNLKEKNLTRFEMSFKKMIALQPYGIKTLSDLTDVTKIRPIIHNLLEKWNDTIYYDKSINLKNLTIKQQKRILYCATPRNWVEFNRMQRMRTKKRFTELMSLHGSTTQKNISDLILQKWNELTATKCIRFNRPIQEKQQLKNVYVLTHIIHSYNVYKNTIIPTPKKSTKTTTKKSTKKRRVCVVCKSNISHKRKGTKYCSKKCNNKHNGMKRTQKNRKRIAKEKEDLQKLVNLLPKNRIWLMVSYKTDNGIYTDTLKQTEIATSAEWIKKVQKVLATEYRKNAPPIILTSYRARKLIKEINKLNI